MTRLLSRDEARAFVETLVSVRNAPDACSRPWADKAHMRRNALLYDYVELDDGAVIRFARPRIEQPPPGFEDGGGEGLFASLNLNALDDRGQRSWERERESAERGRAAAPWHIVRPWIELPEPGTACGHIAFEQRGCDRVEDDPSRRRYLSEGELRALHDIHERRRAAFAKRLQSYWSQRAGDVKSKKAIASGKTP